MSITVRPSNERGHINMGWLDTYHSFSFGDYMDPKHMGFRDLRVINDDTISAAAGFPTHGHRDMEIVTYMVRGALAHKDSTGGEGVIKRGEVQAMSAGSGVRHSEFNASKNDDARLLQIWIMPRAHGSPASYAQAHFADADKQNNLRLLVSAPGAGANLTIDQDLKLYASLLDAGSSLDYKLVPGRAAWLQMVDGDLTINGTKVTKGDGVAVEDVADLKITANQNSEFLLFDLV